MYYNKSNQFIMDNCYRIYNEIENSYYRYADLINYWIFCSLYDKSVDLPNTGLDKIEQFKKNMGNRKLAIDKKLIIELNNRMNLPDIESFFAIREDGQSLIYELIKQGIISINFFIKYADEILTKPENSALLKNHQNKKYRKFDKTIKLLKHLLNIKI
jgi:hypothetical protein